MNQQFNQNNQNRGNNNNGGKNQREPLRLNVEPVPFDGILKSKLTTTFDVSKLINGMLRPTFVDYEGCIVIPDNYGQLQCQLFFKDKGNATDDKVKALSPVTERVKGTGMASRINKLNLRNSNKAYELTQDAKDILGEFIQIPRGQKNINWNNFVFEQTEQNYNGYTIFVKVVNLDINKLVRKIYGGKIEGARIDYNISIIRPIGVTTNTAQNFLINIQQLDSREVEKLANAVGIMPVTGSIQMIRN
ncbi:MAG: hypothetical protein ACRDD7_17065 [Peptostreptococcaceae bacterium]